MTSLPARAGSVFFGILLLAAGAVDGFSPFHLDVTERPLTTVALVAVCVALAFTPPFRHVRRTFRGFMFGLSERAFLLLLFAAGVALYSWSSLFVLHGSPRLDDEVASIFQARIFSTGRVVLPLHPLARFFDVFGVLGAAAGRGHWCGMYPPGWPALLTPGVLLGAVGLVTPVLGGAMVVATAQLGRELFGGRIGRMAGLFALASPLVLVLAGTRLSHVATALFSCWCAVCVLRMLRTGRWGWGALAGGSFGMAFLCRPLTGLVIGAAIALLVFVRWRDGLRAWRGIVAALLLAAAAAGTLAAFQQATTGRWNLPGHVIAMGSRGRIGFGRLDASRTHTPALGIEYSFRRLRALNDRLQGWPVGAFALMAIPWLAGRARWRDAWLLLPATGLLLVFLPFWYYEMYFPGRYISEGAPMLFVLMARGWRELVRSIRRAGPAWRPLPAGLATAGCAFVLGVSNPAYLKPFHINYGDVEAVLPRVVETYGITNAVLFMDQIGLGTDMHDSRNKFYATGFMRNDLALTGDVIYARNMGATSPALMAYYPGRTYYLYRFDRTTSRAQLYTVRQESDAYHLDPVPPRGDPWLEEAPPVEPVTVPQP
ncbi:MAG: glycosyltransferase family 39 protein [bacterium]